MARSTVRQASAGQASARQASAGQASAPRARGQGAQAQESRARGSEDRAGSAAAAAAAAPENPAEVNEHIQLPQPDYDAVDVLVVREPEQLRALGDDLRAKIVVLLRERAASTTELATKLGLPKGTVGHHVKVLEKAGLIRVVRTRKVRAVTERYYGRTARLFLFKSSDDAGSEGVRDVAAASLRTAAEEILPAVDGDRTTFAVLRVRLTDADATRFVRRLERLHREFRAAEDPAGEPYGLAAALYRRHPDA